MKLFSHQGDQGFRKAAMTPFRTLIWIQILALWFNAGYLGSLSLDFPFVRVRRRGLPLVTRTRERKEKRVALSLIPPPPPG